MKRLGLLALALALLGCSRPSPTVASLARLPETLPGIVSDVHKSGESQTESKSSAEPFRIVAVPSELQVYRSTRVVLSVAGDAEKPLRCRWSFGDGSPEEEGCELEHTFIGGTADERVTLTVDTPGGPQKTTRILPLERLPVSAPRSMAGLEIPNAPEGPSSFRVVLLADTAGGPIAALAAQILALGPSLVIHLGGVVTSDDPTSGFTALREGLAEPLRAQHVPLLIAPSPGDLEADAEIRRPLGPDGDALELLSPEGFPERFALSFRGVFFAFIARGDLEAKSDGLGTLAWLKARLDEAQIYESRIVLSHLPLHPFGVRRPGGATSPPQSPETLVPKFKVYELLLRARTTALISAGHAVYFKGRYGALPVLSVGSPVEGATLLGSETPQPPTLAVMDIENGIPVRIFALESKDGAFSQIFDESYLPETVEVYTR